MATTPTATREQWLAARKELLELEKELTHRSGEVARHRRELPRVRVDEPYEFETSDGTKTLAELFDGRSQLIVYHFMHGPNTPSTEPTRPPYPIAIPAASCGTSRTYASGV